MTVWTVLFGAVHTNDQPAVWMSRRYALTAFWDKPKSRQVVTRLTIEGASCSTDPKARTMLSRPMDRSLLVALSTGRESKLRVSAPV